MGQEIQDLRKEMLKTEEEVHKMGEVSTTREKENEELTGTKQRMQTEISDLKDNFEKLKRFNEELRNLVEQEREASIEERESLEEKLDQADQKHQTKLKILKGQLMVLLSSDS